MSAIQIIDAALHAAVPTASNTDKANAAASFYFPSSLEVANKLVVFFYATGLSKISNVQLYEKIVLDDHFPQEIGQELPEYALDAALAQKAEEGCMSAPEVNPSKGADRV